MGCGMRLRRLELAVVALTLAFACFMGGYFIGRRGAVNIVTVSSQNGETQMINTETTSNTQTGSALPGTGATGNETGGGEEASGGNAPSGGDASAAAQAPEGTGAPSGGDGRININYASLSELMGLTGIGSVLAGRIVEYRQQNGPFSRIEDIMNVSGIGVKKFEAIQDRITVG